MTIIRIQTLAILLLLFVSACAKSNTRLAREKDGGEDGGALSDDNPQSDSAASSDSAGSTGTVRAGNSGQGDTATDSLIDAGVDGPFPLDSTAPPPIVGQLEDPEVRQARLDLISEYCSLYEKFPCLDQDDPVLQSFNTMEERLSYCESRQEIYHYEVAGASSVVECESEWEELLKCAIQYPYSCPCTGDECVLYVSPDVVFRAKLIGTSDSFPCIESINAFGACLSVPLPYESINVTGKRMTCDGYVDLLGEENPLAEYTCYVTCPNPSDGDRQYEFRCRGPVLGPYNCHCALNQIELYDAYSIPVAGQIPQQFVPDCETATKMMADGECHDITDCCFTWVNDDGTEGCGCTADVTQSSTRATTCEELAAALGGQVVDLCPQYKNISTPPS